MNNGEDLLQGISERMERNEKKPAITPTCRLDWSLCEKGSLGGRETSKTGGSQRAVYRRVKKDAAWRSTTI